MAASYMPLDAEHGGQEELLVEEQDPQTVSEAIRREVENYRLDCPSRTADCCGATGNCIGNTKARVFSWRCVTCLVTALGRVAFLADFVSDVQVGMTLRSAGNPTWGTIVLALVFVPYICMMAALADYASGYMKTRWHVPQLIGKAIWLVFSFPVLLVTDVALTLRYFCMIPTRTETFHYMSLRKIVELVETVPQLALQMYIYVRLVNPRRIFPSVGGASVDGRLLTASIAFSCYNFVDIYGFLSKFARVQGHGSMLRFFRMMSQLGEGLAPSILYEQLEKDRTVEVSFDLRGASYVELQALAHTAKTSRVLEELSFSDAGWLQSLDDDAKCYNLVDSFLRARKLTSFSLGQGIEPERYALIRTVANGVLKEHPALRVVRLEGFEDLTGQSLAGTDATHHALVQAVRSGDATEAEGLLPGAPIQVIQQSLKAVVAAGHYRMLRLMLSHPLTNPQQMANQSLDDEDGSRPLQVAAKWQQSAAAGLLLVARAGPDLQDNLGRSAVWQAAFGGSVEVLQRLLDARGSPNLQNDEGSSPVGIAAQQNAAEALKYLLKARGDPNLQMEDGRSPVYSAAENNASEALQHLLRAGGDPNLQADDGQSPVYMAAQQNHAEALQHLLGARGDPNLQRDDGRSPVYYAAQVNHIEALQLLLTAHGDPNRRIGDGSTAIHAAAYLNNSEVLEQLLIARGDPSIRDHAGVSPMDDARRANAAEALALLQRHA